MSQNKETLLIEQVTTALKSPEGLSLALRAQVLRLPNAARKEVGMKLAVFSLGLLSEDPVRWRKAIITIGDLLHQLKFSLWNKDGDGFERRPTRS